MFDPQALAKLAHDMKDRAFARSFAQKYGGLLDRRVARIAGALSEFDIVEAMDATLSLKVSSATVGTGELAEIAEQIELDLRRQDLRTARMRASQLPDAARRAHAALEEFLAAA